MSPRATLLGARRDAALAAALPLCTGRVSGMVGLAIEVEGLTAAIGDALRIHRAGSPLLAEVIALHGDRVACMALGEADGLHAGALVEALGRPLPLRMGVDLLGRVLNGLGNPIDDLGPVIGSEDVSLPLAPPHPLRRALVDQQLALGVRVLDTFVPCGRGQRLGLFAGSGVGKSSLLSMIARGSQAQITVIALVGERGREVTEFIRRDLGPEGLARCVVVVATSDEPALVRIRAAFTATRIAEWFRDRGNDVVLLMDSLTRVAMAQRELGLAAGEPPATRGYPPSVFALLPKLLERAGTSERGSITGLYTVLVEGDDLSEPVTDTARSILDGHVVLSRDLANSGHFPAVDVLSSISRVEGAVTTREQRLAVRELRSLLAAYRDARDLVEIGAYVAGSNPVVDRAIRLKDFIDALCRQDIDDCSDLEETQGAVRALVAA